MRDLCRRCLSHLSVRTILRQLKVSAIAVWIGARDPIVPLAARVFGLCVAAYAFSPIDLIPDFIPIIGLLDDMIIIPVGVWIFIRLVGKARHADHLAQAASIAEKPVSTVGALAVILIWICSGAAVVWHFAR
jgi:uncharacterized membrane protein YkvA (DUF1232 family)